MPIPHRIAPLAAKPCSSAASCRISPDFSGLSVCAGQVAYALLTRAPVAGGRGRTLSPDAPRLACVKPVASVHPEPGSNSPLFVSLNLFFFVCCTKLAPCGRSGRFIAVFGFDKEACHVNDPSLVLLIVNIANVSKFSVSLPALRLAEKRCKVNAYFSNHQTFLGKFLFFLFQPLPEGVVLKSECKGRHFLHSLQIFTHLFSKNF